MDGRGEQVNRLQLVSRVNKESWILIILVSEKAPILPFYTERKTNENIYSKVQHSLLSNHIALTLLCEAVLHANLFSTS